MELTTAFRLKESFARTAVQELVEARYPEDQRAKVLDLFDAAMARAQSDLEKHLPQIDEKHAAEILAAM